MQSCHDHTHAAIAFSEAEFAFIYDALTFVDVILFFINLSVLFQSSESRILCCLQ